MIIRVSARRPSFIFAGLLFILFLSSAQAQDASPNAQPREGGNWQRVKVLPMDTNLHITTDHGGKTCRVFAVTDETLICAKGNTAGSILQRAEIRHIKLTHYDRSTLMGAAVGGGIGATVGAIGGRTRPCPNPQSFCLNGIGIGSGGIAAIFGVASGLVGGVIGGVTDLSRGRSIYVRP